MSNELENTTQATTPETVVPVIPEVKNENTVPSYRLKEEADKRRTAETKLAEYEAKDKAKADEELSFKERYDKKVTEFDTFKATAATKALQNDFVSQARALGFPEKIAKLGAPNELTEDGMKDSLKAFSKEFAEFLPTDKKEDPKPSNPFAAIQPNTVDPSPGTRADRVTGQQVMDELTKNIKQ